MAERIVSPGVFTQERDQSFLAQGVAEIGAAFVGPTTRGPAFIPTVVNGIDGFVNKFGTPDGSSYMGYTVQNYLQEAGSATVVRVLGLSGYSTTGAYLYVSGSSQVLFAAFHPTTSGSSIQSILVAGTTASFSLVISSSNVAGPHISASGLNFDSTSPSYIGSYFSNPSNTVKSPAYVYAIFPDAINQAGVFVAGTQVAAETGSFNFTSATNKQYKNASTPWIESQLIGGQRIELFKLHTLSDGVSANKQIKISIAGISPNTDGLSSYGTFSLLVRTFDDTDISPNVIERYDGLTLNPNDANYIARRIGDSVPTYNSETGEAYYEGEYPNLSEYIRVEMAENIPEIAVPYGFDSYQVVEDSGYSAAIHPKFVVSRWSNGGFSAENASLRPYYYGFNFEDQNNLSILAPVKFGAANAGSGFSLETTPNGSLPANEYSGTSVSLSNPDHIAFRRFTVGFQGGFDGFSPSREIALGGAIRGSNTQGFDLTNSLSSGSFEYARAIRVLSNPDNIDLNLLVLPGVIYRVHPYIAQSAIDMCEQRGDCFYILDLDTLDANIESVTLQARLLDTNYAGGYYPWVRVLDTNTNKLIWAPPSVVLPEVYKYSDNVGAEWFAPAGLNRGGIPGAVGVKTRLNQAQRDTLYEAKVNPIAQFPGQGICVWGQKTLQTRLSALDRVNVRRLLITVKKYIASSARYLVFEQNTEATRNRFLNIVNPYLAGIQQRSGLTTFRVVMDDSNNTPDLIDRNILVGAIYLQPTRTAEVIKLDFNILPTGATFDTI